MDEDSLMGEQPCDQDRDRLGSGPSVKGLDVLGASEHRGEDVLGDAGVEVIVGPSDRAPHLGDKPDYAFPGVPTGKCATCSDEQRHRVQRSVYVSASHPLTPF